MFDYKMEHVFSYCALIQPPVVVSPTDGDIRLNFYVTGGEITGPRLVGKILPIGADWMVLRKDGVALLDVRAAFESHDGAHIDISYNGIIDIGPDGHDRFVRGDLPEVLHIRAAPRFRTAHPDYLWMNRCQFINVGAVWLQSGEVRYDVYALS